MVMSWAPSLGVDWWSDHTRLWTGLGVTRHRQYPLEFTQGSTRVMHPGCVDMNCVEMQSVLQLESHTMFQTETVTVCA